MAAVLVMASCGGEKKARSGKIEGKWQPVGIKLDIKGLPKIIRNQMENLEDIEEQLLSNRQKEGWLELKEDGTFLLMDTPDSEGWSGTWSYDGKKISVENDVMPLAFEVESVTDNELQIDYASVYKSVADMRNIPFMPEMKMIMTYKRITE